MIRNFWDEIESSTHAVIDDFAISEDDLTIENLENTNEELSKRIERKTSETAQIICEQIKDKINAAVENEAEKMSDFNALFMQSMSNIQ